ncbi:MAG TPA: beta-phosphoglucomutase family hydrolase [Bacteroidales bacterium]|nr:beta-phosphoglucomutase family hydrolase [Bacteroidales bacterium]
MEIHHFDAVIFDLDGVITKTALVHSSAWTRMFNDFLTSREEKYGESYSEFTHEKDYLPYVDGKPRYKGVADFLKSRDIDIPFGDPSDPPEKETVCGLGNRKNNYFTDILEKDGVEVYETSVAFIRQLRSEGIRVGVASSSKNCKKVLETAGLIDLFETRVDGLVSADMGLKGKPEPDIFTTACDNLNVAYDRSVVVEDAVSGVQAGAAGGFGLTLGIAREGNVAELRKNGADIVVEDIGDLGGIEAVNRWFKDDLEKLRWSVLYKSYDKEKEKSREALLTTGNGFFASRGAMEETSAGEYNYPGSYMTGLYNRRKSKVSDRWIENEDFVNFINWLPVNFRVDGGEWFDPNAHDFHLIERRLDLKTGMLYRSLIVKHDKGRETLVESRRFVSMADPHLGGLEYKVTPVNYAGKIEIMSALDGDLINDGVERYSDLDQHHLDQLDQGTMNGLDYVIVKTNQSDITVSVAQKLDVTLAGKMVNRSSFEPVKGKVTSYFESNAAANECLQLRKIVCIHNSRDFEVNNPLGAVAEQLSAEDDFNKIFGASEQAWGKIWKKSDIAISGDRYSQMLIRLHIFHLLTTASPHHKHLDAGIPARGLHGEAYRGHIFWDELYVLPFFATYFPETARSVLMYRYRRLNKARQYAADHNYEGAMFPWQSGSDGREETQVVHLNPVSGEWGDDYSSLQRHISSAIAYNIWQYYKISADQDFMNQYGAEMFFEICRFWASKAKKDEKTGRYSIGKVMGPDEFHEKLPDADEGGLKDNAYINIMSAWIMKTAFSIMDQLDINERKRIVEKIELKKEELVKWKEMSLKMNLLFNDNGILEQFQGYFDLKELDWDEYRKKYDDIHRMDRILKAEGNSPDDYKVAKQADALMTFYNLDKDEVISLLHDMGYEADASILKKNFDYYLPRTSHGSTLSRVVHAYLARLTGKNELCDELYMEALASDYVDIQGGTTGEGIHVGVMGGTVLNALTIYAGVNWHGETLRLDPALPPGWKSLAFNFNIDGRHFHFEISAHDVKIQYNSDNGSPGRIFVKGIKCELENSRTIFVEL